MFREADLVAGDVQVPAAKLVFEDYLVAGTRWMRRSHGGGGGTKEVLFLARSGRTKVQLEDVATGRRSTMSLTTFRLKYFVVEPLPAVLAVQVLAEKPPATAELTVVPPSELVAEEAAADAEFEFAGHTVRVWVFRGRPCILAAEAGRALGYANDGKELANMIRRHWNDDMILGRDFDVLTGSELREFKQLVGLTGEAPVGSDATGGAPVGSDATGRAPVGADATGEAPVGAEVSHLMVLYESGWDLVCFETDKPGGKQLRHRMATEIMPKVRRGEALGTAGASPAVIQAIANLVTAALAQRLDLTLGRLARVELNLTDFERDVDEKLGRLAHDQQNLRSAVNTHGAVTASSLQQILALCNPFGRGQYRS